MKKKYFRNYHVEISIFSNKEEKKLVFNGNSNSVKQSIKKELKDKVILKEIEKGIKEVSEYFSYNKTRNKAFTSFINYEPMDIDELFIKEVCFVVVWADFFEKIEDKRYRTNNKGENIYKKRLAQIEQRKVDYKEKKLLKRKYQFLLSKICQSNKFQNLLKEKIKESLILQVEDSSLNVLIKQFEIKTDDYSFTFIIPCNLFGLAFDRCAREIKYKEDTFTNPMSNEYCIKQLRNLIEVHEKFYNDFC